MNAMDWMREFPGAVTICNLDGIVVEMNDKSAETFRKHGGLELIGKSLFDCHPEPARGKLAHLLQTGGSNAYTIEKDGIRKLIYQAPWYANGRRHGMVEIALEIPPDLPHFVR